MASNEGELGVHDQFSQTDRAPGELVALATFGDVMQAQLAAGVLEGEGIVVAAPGLNHRSMLGIVGAYIEITLMVPAADLERARGLLSQLSTQKPQDLRRGRLELEPRQSRDPTLRGDPYRSPAGTPKNVALSPRRKRVAAFCSLALTFGSGHFYALEWGSGIALLMAQVAVIAAALTLNGKAMLALIPLVAYDLVGSLRSIGRQQQCLGLEAKEALPP